MLLYISYFLSHFISGINGGPYLSFFWLLSVLLTIYQICNGKLTYPWRIIGLFRCQNCCAVLQSKNAKKQNPSVCFR